VSIISFLPHQIFPGDSLLKWPFTHGGTGRRIKENAHPLRSGEDRGRPDRIKTEALSRAQYQFLDASTLTVAPVSDIVIESYMYDPKKGKQGALSRLTQGLVRLVVPVETLSKKEFLVNTPSAILGIRGTELYILIGPDFTDVV
jgi:hypothetical protein